MKLVDLTRTIAPEMPVYPGTEPPELRPANTYEENGFRETLLTLYSHTGTHMDAPAHLFPHRTTLDRFPAEQFVGRALVIHCPVLREGEKIPFSAVEQVRPLADRADFLLFDTGWGRYWGTERYFGDYPVPDDQIIDYLLAGGKKGVGLDTIGIDPIADEALTIHRKLFAKHDIVVLENLANLDQLGEDLFTLFALPLKFENADGAPIRAVAALELEERRAAPMNFQYYINHRTRPEPEALALTGAETLARASRFHRSIPGYAPTPLVALDGLARQLGVAEVLVKDESKRFGLNAFKALGGSYAMARYLAQRLGWPEEELSFPALCRPEVREQLGEITFVTATDGNHGRGVAWAARQLGQKAVVYMPKGSAAERLENIRAQGAQAEITDLNYDDAVRLASDMARKHGWVLVQDTAWPGYEEIPAWIMEGYTTIAQEIFAQLEAEGRRPPTHLFLQAGVGSFAGAMLGSFQSRWGSDCPVTCIVEPDQADCLYRSARAADGRLHPVTGDMNSMMAGLCCGEPCTISWRIIRPCADAFLSCGDEYAARGMRLLGHPAPGDPAVVSGESGAVGVGVLAAILHDDALEDLRWTLGLNAHSRVLCVSTEGDTDRENYQKILNSGL